MKRSRTKTFFALYLGLGVLTLFFQLYIRSQACAQAGNCAVEYTKAVIWAVIWPASWVVYLKGVPLLSFYSLIGIVLICVALYDQWKIKSSWRFHAFYTGLALLISGQILDYLFSIRTISDAVLHDLRTGNGSIHDHVVAIRTLLDKILIAPRP